MNVSLGLWQLEVYKRRSANYAEELKALKQQNLDTQKQVQMTRPLMASK